MKFYVKVKTGSKKPRVERIDKTHFAVSVSARPVKGEANKAVIKALSEYLDLSPSRIILISGKTSKQKVFEIMN